MLYFEHFISPIYIGLFKILDSAFNQTFLLFLLPITSINPQDVNDHRPEFQNVPYSVEVDEVRELVVAHQGAVWCFKFQVAFLFSPLWFVLIPSCFRHTAHTGWTYGVQRHPCDRSGQTEHSQFRHHLLHCGEYRLLRSLKELCPIGMKRLRVSQVLLVHSQNLTWCSQSAWKGLNSWGSNFKS